MKSTGLKPRNAKGRRRFGRAQDDHILDPYKRPRKLAEPAVCPHCGAVYQNGRWHWAARPEDAHKVVCQACHRINDHYPAGIVTIASSLTAKEKTELLNLVRHQEKVEKAEHPLNRIIDIEERPEAIVITTTDIHLPRRIGEAIQRAFRGRHTTHFDENGYFVRVNWCRDDK